jgi:hypothetical protein
MAVNSFFDAVIDIHLCAHQAGRKGGVKGGIFNAHVDLLASLLAD